MFKKINVPFQTFLSHFYRFSFFCSSSEQNVSPLQKVPFKSYQKYYFVAEIQSCSEAISYDRFNTSN